MIGSWASAVSSSPWTYALVLAFAAFDALLPLVPSETAAIAAGVLAATGELQILLVGGAAAAGAFLGDNASYVVGRTAGNAAVSRLYRPDGGLPRLQWAARVLETRGWYLIVVARFIPGGRTAVTLTSGLTRMRVSRFIPAAAAAAILWASFAAGLGYLGGTAFETSPWRGLVAALVVAAVIVGGIEAARWFYRPRHRVCGHCDA